MHQRVNSKPFVRAENLNARTKVEHAFIPRIAKKCKAVGIHELGDFQNNTVEVLYMTGMVGFQTIETVENTLREANVIWIEEKIRLLQDQAKLIVNYQKNKNNQFGALAKKQINFITRQIDLV